MKRRALAILICVLLVCALLPTGALAASGMSNFRVVQSYREGQFSDVKSSAWYAPNVATAYRLGLVKGAGDGSFDVGGYVTLAEAVTMAARLHSTYYTGSGDFQQGSPWYQVYVDYALKNGILDSGYLDYERYASRAEYAKILSRALPASALPAINQIEDGAVPDVPANASYAPGVYTLYRAGILTGHDEKGSYKPNDNIRRDEICALITRMADPSLRKEFTLSPGGKDGLTAEQIFEKCSPAVFYIEVYDKRGDFLGSGSGFFIDSSGIAVTNHHVIEGASSAAILLPSGDIYEVAGAYDISEANDLALLQIAVDKRVPTLEIGDSRNLKAGATVYTLGSPQGLDNTLSDGLISNVKRPISGVDYIQISAPISHGSSGGALLNSAGQVIGVTSGGIDGGQNLNLAIPVHLVELLRRGQFTPLGSNTPPSISYYDSYGLVPDYGAFVGAPCDFSYGTADEGIYHCYYLKTLNAYGVTAELGIDGYMDLLKKCDFAYTDSFEANTGYTILVYEHNTYYVTVLFGMDVDSYGNSYMVVGYYYE